MTTAQFTLYATGLTCSIVGTVLWAWNDFGSWIASFMRRVAGRCWRFARSVLVRVGLLHGRVYVDAGTATVTFSGHADAVKSLGDDAPLERKLAFLMEQDREHQVRFQRLERELRAAITENVETLRRDLDSRIADEILQLRTERVAVRRAGVALVVVGLVLLSIYPYAG